MGIINKLTGKPQPEVLILVREAQGGITTYLSPMLFRMAEAHKQQLNAFIDQIKDQIQQKTR